MHPIRIALIIFFLVVGLAPTAITSLAALAMMGKPVPCLKPGCQAHTNSAELLILPASTLAPFICGILMATVATKRKQLPSVQRRPVLVEARRSDETAA
jgi:hypothetical protein